MRQFLLLLAMIAQQVIFAEVAPKLNQQANQTINKHTIKKLHNKDLTFKTSIDVDNLKQGDSICVYRDKNQLGCSPISEDPTTLFKRPNWHLSLGTFGGINYLLPAVHINKTITPRISLGLAPFLTFSGFVGNSQSTLGVFLLRRFMSALL